MNDSITWNDATLVSKKTYYKGVGIYCQRLKLPTEVTTTSEYNSEASRDK